MEVATKTIKKRTIFKTSEALKGNSKKVIHVKRIKIRTVSVTLKIESIFRLIFLILSSFSFISGYKCHMVKEIKARESCDKNAIPKSDVLLNTLNDNNKIVDKEKNTPNPKYNFL